MAVAFFLFVGLYWLVCVIWGIVALREWLRVDWDKLNCQTEQDSITAKAFVRIESDRLRQKNIYNIIQWTIGITILVGTGVQFNI